LLEPLLSAIGALSLGVFILAFRFIASETSLARAQRFEPSLPRAALRTTGHAAGPRWLRGLGRQRLLACVRVLQNAIVARGVTATFIMFLCMAGIVATMLVGLR
jgi:hypothetical protein